MSEKNIMAVDGLNIKDGTCSSSCKKNWYDTNIIIRDPDTKEILFKGKNKVVLSGGDIVARKLFDIEADRIIPTYNEELSLDDGNGAINGSAQFETTSFAGTAATKDDPKVLLFCIGTDGCGSEGSQIYTVDYNSRIAPEALVPFRFPTLEGDIDDQLRNETYFGRKELTNSSGQTFVAYYFKAFDAPPTLYRLYSDGSPINSDVYDSGNPDVDCYVQITLKITKDEMREYFVATTGIDQCRFNTISLCSGYPVEISGYTYFRDIRPITKLNISNEYMIDVTKGVEIVYQVYF